MSLLTPGPRLRAGGWVSSILTLSMAELLILNPAGLPIKSMIKYCRKWLEAHACLLLVLSPVTLSHISLLFYYGTDKTQAQ
jgi:hypothetical protein